MTAQEYFDIGKLYFDRPGKNPEIRSLEKHVSGEYIVRFNDVILDMPLLKAILETAELKTEDVDIKDLVQLVSCDMIKDYYDNTFDPEKDITIKIVGENYNVACRTFTITSAVELKKVLEDNDL